MLPVLERCDTVDDDDCNGLVNEASAGCRCAPGVEAQCYPGPAGTVDLGPCRAGVMTCLPDGSGFGECRGAVVPQPDECDSDLDLDCDGRVHDAEDGCCTPGQAFPCKAGPPGLSYYQSACSLGWEICLSDAKTRSSCEGYHGPEVEDCGDLIDNDCDGDVDEEGPSCVCTPRSIAACYSGPPGTEGVGACAAGTATCQPDGMSMLCEHDVRPADLENCATREDEDCDGASAATCFAPGSTFIRSGTGQPDVVFHPDGATSLFASSSDTRRTLLGLPGPAVEQVLVEQAGYAWTLVPRGTQARDGTLVLHRCDYDVIVAGTAINCWSNPGYLAIRYDTNGQPLWIRKVTGAEVSFEDAVALPGGDILIAALYWSTTAFVDVVLPKPAASSAVGIMRVNAGTGLVTQVLARDALSPVGDLSVDASSTGTLGAAWTVYTDATQAERQLHVITFDGQGTIAERDLAGGSHGATIRFGPGPDLWLQAALVANAFDGVGVGGDAVLARYSSLLERRWVRPLLQRGALAVLGDGRAALLSQFVSYGHWPKGRAADAATLAVFTPEGEPFAALPVRGVLHSNPVPRLVVSPLGRLLLIASSYAALTIGDDALPGPVDWLHVMHERIP